MKPLIERLLRLIKSHKLRFSLIGFFLLLWILSTFPFYSGDGLLKDNGWLRLGHRYEIIFNEFLIEADTTTKEYSFSGVPREKYYLQLYLLSQLPDGVRQTSSNYKPVYEELKNAEVKIGVTLLKDGETYVHIPLSSIRSWVYSSWRTHHQDFPDTTLSKHPNYTLRITVDSSDLIGREIFIQPSLLGGANNVF